MELLISVPEKLKYYWKADGVIIEYALKLAFKVTNSMAKYKDLAKGLDLARKIKLRRLTVYSESQFVRGQINGKFKAKEEKMAKHHTKAQGKLERMRVESS